MRNFPFAYDDKIGRSLTAKINGIAKRDASLNAEIHLVSCQAMAHACEHGDYSKLNLLHDKLHVSKRKSAWVSWVVAHTPLNYQGKDTDKRKAGFYKGKDKARDWNFSEAYAMPFWDYAPAPSVPDMDCDKGIAAINEAMIRAAKSVAKRMADTKANGGKLKGNVAKLEALLAQYVKD
jgi:hypothetical protein